MAVVGIDVDADGVGERVRDLGPSVQFVACDVREETSVAAAVEHAGAGGSLRIVVNCAGVATPGRIVGRRGPHELAGALRMR